MDEPKDNDSAPFDLTAEEMSEDVENEFRALRAKRARKLQRTGSQHQVEASLEDFVAKARGDVIDTTSFVPETREQILAREIEALRGRLAAAEARIDASAPVPKTESRSRWWGIAAAFVVGAASMFAVSFAIKREVPERPHVETRVETSPVVAPTPPPVVTPLPVEVAPPVEPVVVAPAPQPLTTVPHPKRPVARPENPAPTKPKPAPSSNELFDPFAGQR